MNNEWSPPNQLVLELGDALIEQYHAFGATPLARGRTWLLR